MLLIAHISDLHLDGGQLRLQRARRVMTYLNRLPGPLHAVLVAGDLTENGLAEEYQQAAEVLASPLPVFVCPGNHDRRGPFREILLGEEAVENPDDHPIDRAHRVEGAVFAMCDSVIPGHDGGYLADGTLEWLEGLLRETPPRTPVFVGVHHPPVELHNPVVDVDRQRAAHRLARVIEQYPNVAAVLCGHAHTAVATIFAGRPLAVAPGIVSGVALPWERDEEADLERPLGVAFHVLDDGHLVTHYRTVPATPSATTSPPTSA